MIRLLQKSDMETICNIINDNWESVYSEYINEDLLNKEGCIERENRLKKDFLSGRLSNYIYECDSQPVALLSIGNTADKDKIRAFELWRIYILNAYQNRGIGTLLLDLTEKEAIRSGYKEVLIWVFKGNVHALSFYKKHGYRQDKECYLGQPYFTYGIRLSKELNYDVHTCAHLNKMKI